MIKKILLQVVPLTKNALLPTLRLSSTFPLASAKIYFSTQKQNTSDAKPGSKKQQATSKSQQNEDKTQPSSGQKQPEKKLTDLSNNELIKLNTQQSLKIVHLNIKKMQEKRAKQNEELAELNKKMEYLSKHHSQSINKEQLLLQNIKLQQQQLSRIKKRAEKQVQDSKDFGITKLAKQLLQFADSIKRCRLMAEQQLKDAPNDQYLKKIVDLHQQLKDFLKLYDIEQFDPINQPFDPNMAEGLVTIPTPPGYVKNNVATTMMTGYKIKSRLLRSAKVGIFI